MRFYTNAEALSTIKQVELIDKKELAKTALDEESKTFVMHVVALDGSPQLAEMMMHSSRAAHIAALKQDAASTKIPSKYVDYADVFLFDLATE